VFDESLLTFEMKQSLDEEGNVIGGKELDIESSLMLDMYKWMKKCRLLDEKMLRMQRQGRLAIHAPFSGQEAAQVGSAFALGPNDWICPSYRDVAACLIHGMPIEQVLYYFKGHFEGGKTPENVNVLPIQIIIAAQTLHAVGISYASKIKGESAIAISYFGDGATSEGDFHEALNFAAVQKTPTIFFCQNNQYAISVPLKQQMASKTIAQKAIAYGMKGIQVDGNDVAAVYEATREAAERARNGEGPTLIEAVTYRLGPHTTSDDPTKYRNNEEKEEWLRKDPIIRVKKWLYKQNVWSEDQDINFEKNVQDELNQIIDEVEKQDSPKLDEIFNHVYEKPNDLLLEQQMEAKDLVKGKAGVHHG